jgi:hypothetical protein
MVRIEWTVYTIAFMLVATQLAKLAWFLYERMRPSRSRDLSNTANGLRSVNHLFS